MTVLFSIFPHIPFLFLTEHSVADKVLDKDCRQGEKKPDAQKKQAHLTHDIEWQVAVIPDLHTETDIDNNAADKFRRGDYKRTDNHLYGHGNLPFEKAVQSPYPHKAKSPGNEH